jgi:ubiquinone/menaquinone biosynthesis C-methylase UbiE
MNDNTQEQRDAFEQIFSAEAARWHFHDTKDPLIRYLRDRRLHLALDAVRELAGISLEPLSVLLVCGGVGGEASFFANHGFADVTNTDFSQNALNVCERRDPRLKTRLLNAEAMDLEDGSYDLVVVQDGLHHLPRPALGLNEMIRVARKAVIVLEPHTGFVAKAIGTEWERHGDAVNFVYRWNLESFRQVILSQLLESPKSIRVIRLWDHNSVIRKVVSKLGGGGLSLFAAKAIYALLTPFNALGNNFIGVLVKQPHASSRP